MDRQLRDLVRNRAGRRCEYCRLRQEHFLQITHQVEHIIPIKHRGSDAADNLAPACAPCNLSKSSNLSGIDDVKSDIVTLFNPRTQDWFEHFEFQGAVIAGIATTGRATVLVLNMNDDERLQLRTELLLNGELD
jgi:hypothetical protein